MSTVSAWNDRTLSFNIQISKENKLTNIDSGKLTINVGKEQVKISSRYINEEVRNRDCVFNLNFNHYSKVKIIQGDTILKFEFAEINRKEDDLHEPLIFRSWKLIDGDMDSLSGINLRVSGLEKEQDWPQRTLEACISEQMKNMFPASTLVIEVPEPFVFNWIL